MKNQFITSINQTAMNYTVSTITKNNNIMKTKSTFETFEKFLNNIYSRANNGKFLSTYSYLSYIKAAMKDLRIDEYILLNSNSTQLKVLLIKLHDEPCFINRSETHKNNINSSFNALINFKRYNQGLIQY